MGAGDLLRAPGNHRFDLGEPGRYARLEFGDGDAAWLLAQINRPGSGCEDTGRASEPGLGEPFRRLARRVAAVLL